jgi:hypothetical protein
MQKSIILSYFFESQISLQQLKQSSSSLIDYELIHWELPISYPKLKEQHFVSTVK